MNINEVSISKNALRALRTIPNHVVFKLQAWIHGVKTQGWHTMRQVPGFHDEALKGQRKLQRSIRLSKAYRAIYVFHHIKESSWIEITEVNKHEY